MPTLLVIDGQEDLPIYPSDIVEVVQGSPSLPVVRVRQSDFYRNLAENSAGGRICLVIAVVVINSVINQYLQKLIIRKSF